MTIEQLAPSAEPVDLAATMAKLKAGISPEPFGEEVMSFCAEFSRQLFRDAEANRYPELQALAFWMRKAELVRMREEFAALATPRTIRVPRGLVFHVPPANVDTIFIYSWLMAVLTGNRNIIRLSPRPSGQVDVICRVFNSTLESAPEALRHNTVMVRYGHEREITAALSAAADVRVLWGGDATIQTIRAVTLPPHATELTFPDRYSFAVIRTAAYRQADETARKQLADSFFNDTFWFDQMACSSPRLVVWQGERAATDDAAREFLELVHSCAGRKGYQVHPQTRLNRFTFACGAVLDGTANRYEDFQEVTVLGIEGLPQFSREHCGGGLLFQHRVASLEELIPFVTRRDQTMTYFGFDAAELRCFAARLNGRGVDRIVPVGRALQFDRFWDGFDLLQELTRHVYIGA